MGFGPSALPLSIVITVLISPSALFSEAVLSRNFCFQQLRAAPCAWIGSENHVVYAKYTPAFLLGVWQVARS